uniref:Uncharacterized protein n=1 Tax=Timema poppense TaxID=170557 RepID=A0A7R9DCN4_TIMPO|nr:unnamed protein product [Timema poppensis]
MHTSITDYALNYERIMILSMGISLDSSVVEHRYAKTCYRCHILNILIGDTRVLRTVLACWNCASHSSLAACKECFDNDKLKLDYGIIIIVTKCDYYYNRPNEDDNAIQVLPEVGMHPDRRPIPLSSVFYVGSRSRVTRKTEEMLRLFAACKSVEDNKMAAPGEVGDVMEISKEGRSHSCSVRCDIIPVPHVDNHDNDVISLRVRRVDMCTLGYVLCPQSG